jgi:hypothetical protein
MDAQAELESIVVRIDVDDQPQGTGFVAADDLVVTCAHVVADGSGQPAAHIEIGFRAAGESRPAQVVPEYWRAPEAEDIAVLRFAGGLPQGVQTARLGRSTDTHDHPCETFGYPEAGAINGLHGRGTVYGPVTEDGGRTLLQVSSKEITPGFSGAPVLDVATRRVIGMATEILQPDRFGRLGEVAFLTPIETIRAVCPKLREAARTIENPFHTKGRINDPALFFNRERLVREIQMELKKRCSVSLVGKSQIGKSSLLYYLFRTSADWLPGVAMVYVDLQRVLDEADFCENVLQPLGESGSTLRDLRRALDTRDVVLLLDEVEKLFDKDFSPKLHNLLRALAQESNFAMCVATQRPLEEVFPPSNSTSPFHNIFTRKTLGPFSEADARRFLATTLASTGVAFSAHDIERLLRDSQGHPAQLQRLAKELYDQLSGD